MEAFAIIGFIFGLMAFTTASANSTQMKKLQHELESLTKEVEGLRAGRES